ncbi:hypothetical protein [Nocardiopsis oceani]
MLTVVFAAASVTPLADHYSVQHDYLAEAPADPAPVPTDAAVEGWTWAPPLDAAAVRVDAGTHGPVVVLEDGLVGLHGETGEELWTHRSPYPVRPPQWAMGVVDGRNDLAAVVVEAEESGDGGELHRRLLDTATGEVVEEGPFLGEELLDGAHGPEISAVDAYVFRTEGDLIAVGPGGEELWERPASGWDGERGCLFGPEGAAFHQDQVILGELCTDQELEAHSSDGYRHVLSMIEEGGGTESNSVVALDVATGQENWRRDWEARDGDHPPVPEPSEPLRPGAEPLVKVGDRVLDTGTGADSAALGRDADDLESLASELGVFAWHADSQGALIPEWYPSGSDEPLLLHRTGADGDVLDTTALPDSVPTDQVGSGAVLANTLVYADNLPPRGFTSGDPPPAAVLVTPLGEGAAGDGSTGRIDLESGLSDQRAEVPHDELGELGERDESGYSLTPVPGAVAMLRYQGYRGHQVAQVHGLVP